MEIERPPQKLWMHELYDMLCWYENNLCAAQLVDPRGAQHMFSPERFPHMIKLLKFNSEKEVDNPQQVVMAIRNREKRNSDFGGYDTERAQTLPWIIPTILRPTAILEVVERTLWEKPGDTLYLKEFEKKGYRHKVLVCRTVGQLRYVPVTCHPRSDGRIGKAYRVIWP
jgi:hypothetical protein